MTLSNGRNAGWHMALMCLIACLSTTGLFAADEEQQRTHFEKHIRPLLVEKCYECHASTTEASGGLVLDSRIGWQRGGDSGAAVVPGQPDASRLIKAVEYADPDLQMPPDGALTASEVKSLRKWIEAGAFDPRESRVNLSAQPSGLPLARAQEHWAYRPLSTPEVPALTGSPDLAVANNSIDAFIGKPLIEADVPVAGAAARGELLRRLSYDLHGLPPSVDSLKAIEADSQPDAIERAIDRLLASPRFGERMARHWMDVARYAESLTLRGFVLPQAWRYRDYLISSFRDDRPFHELVAEQVAGDLLEHTDIKRRHQQLIATTFLTLGNTNLEEQDKAQLEMDYIDEQLEVIGRVFMGQTIGCARCHDHKFDPIPTSDYYALAGVFKASQAMQHDNVSKWIEKPLPADAEQEDDLNQAEVTLKRVVTEEARIEKLLGKKTAPKKNTVIEIASLPGIVIDDAAAMKVGNWTESHSVRPFVGDGYIHDGNARDVIKTLTFQPERTPPGQSQVRLAYTPGANRSSKVVVRVFSADGETSVTINQRTAPPIDGVWFLLGEFRFEKDGQAFVLVSNEGADGHVVADAVQFLPVADKDRSATAVAGAETGRSLPTGKSEETAQDARLSMTLEALKVERKQLEAVLAGRPRYMTINETLPAKDIPIHIRGSVHNLGPIVPRGFLQCADFAPRSSLTDETSGRKEFAQWLSDARHPLTARVFVNRLWLWLYGAGIVRTVDNFGTTGELPTHPELLDYLARDFIEHDWSPQFAMRRMLLSATYQRSAEADERALELDPENKLFGRSRRKRLDVESLRDAMLAISGELAIPPGGATLRAGVKEDYRYEHVPTMRAVYQPLLRNSLPELYDAFDFPNPSVPSGVRSQSVVSPQALAMLNSSWVRARAAQAADEILHQFDAQEEAFAWKDFITEAFLRCLGREPTTIERYTAQTLIDELEESKSERKQIASRVIHALFASIDFRYLE